VTASRAARLPGLGPAALIMAQLFFFSSLLISWLCALLSRDEP
jgi:hypothetical protein